MPDRDAFLARRPVARTIVAADRAARAWARIQDRPTSITVYRDSIAQTAQTVRIEATNSRANIERRDAGEVSVLSIILFGVRGHATQADTDLERGDLFTYGGGQYRVIDVWRLPGEVQARAERLT